MAITVKNLKAKKAKWCLCNSGSELGEEFKLLCQHYCYKIENGDIIFVPIREYLQWIDSNTFVFGPIDIEEYNQKLEIFNEEQFEFCIENGYILKETD